MNSALPIPDVEAPKVEYGRSGECTSFACPRLGEGQTTSHSEMDELRMRVLTLENDLAATKNASSFASKTLLAVYDKDAHALR